MKKFLSIILLGVLLLGLLAGCANTNAPDEDQDVNTDAQTPVVTNERVQQIDDILMEQIGAMPQFDGDEKLGALIISLTNPYWVGMKEAYEAAAEQYGVTIEVMSAPSEGDKQSQLDTLQAMALKDYDAIVLSPIEPFNLLDGIVACNENSIPVINLGPGINLDSLTEMGGHLDGRLTVDFEDQGRQCGQDIVDRIGSGKVAIIQGISGAAQSEGRTQGASAAFNAAEGIEIVSVQPGDWDSTTAYNIAADLLTAHPDLKAIFCCNDVMALAASQALIDAGVKDGILIYGVDGTEEAKTAIKEGRMDGTITYPSSSYAKAAVVMLLKLAQGMDMSQTIYCPLDIINTDNVSEFDGYK